MGEEGRAKVGQAGGQGGLPALEPGKIVRIPLADLHEFLERHGVEIVGRLDANQGRLVVELAPVRAAAICGSLDRSDEADESLDG